MAEQSEQSSRQVAVWDPWRQLERLQDEFDRLWGGPLFSWRRPAFTRAAEWRPRCDVYEDGGDLVVKAELPGVKKEDIQVELDEGVLTIRGSRKEEKEIKEDQYYRMERASGTFFRQIPLPGPVKADQIKANYKDGVLEVRLPKPAPEQPKATRIPVG